jgi:hypothetical protein
MFVIPCLITSIVCLCLSLFLFYTSMALQKDVSEMLDQVERHRDEELVKQGLTLEEIEREF